MNIVNIKNNPTNCYLVRINDGWVLIDTGFPDTFSTLLKLLNQNNISAHEINYLIITHFHPDHAGLTQNLRDLGIHLILHEAQVPFTNKLNLFYKKNPRANFKDIIQGNAILLSASNSRSFLKTIGISGDLIATPGHSDDSVSLVIDEDCAFTGDLPSFDLMDAYDDPLTRDSWNMILKYNVKRIYPAHGDSYDLG